MRFASLFVVFAAVVIAGLAGCSASNGPAATVRPVLDWPRAAKRIVIVQPDIVLGLVTTGGLIEPQADWSALARSLLLTDITAHLREKGIDPVVADPSTGEQNARLMRLYTALTTGGEGPGTRADLRKRAPLRDCLGPETARLAARYDADYGLLLLLRDNYTSTGRVAANVAASVVVAVLTGGYAGKTYSDASRMAQISLVDLRSGVVVWTKKRTRDKGNLREAGDAQNFVRALLKEMPL